jgi:polyhydroxyalkanoate synthesis regulator phasin
MASNSDNLVDNIVDTQKKVLDNVVENAKKFTTGNTALNETIEKGTDWYKNWLESQKTMFTKAAGFAAGATEAAGKTETASDKGGATKPNEYMEQWMTTQANWAKQIWEMSQEAAKKFGPGNNTNPFASWTNNTTNPFAGFTNNNANPFASWTNQTANPFASWTNPGANPFASWQNPFNGANNPMTAWMNQANATNWMNQMQGMNPFNNDSTKKATENVTNMFTQFYSTLNSSFAEWQKSFENGTVQDAYKGMINSAEGFTKFAEMWMPMIKSMQDKTFSMDEYKKMMNPETYKEFMDKFFGFMPESSREYMNKLTGVFNDSMKQAGASGMTGYQQMRDMMSKMPGANNGGEIFSNIKNAYGTMQSQMNEAFAPFTKMMTPNQQTRSMQDWSKLSDDIINYNLKNAELQYMMYTQGAKVMDQLAENTAKKMQDGATVTSIVDLYQEWMNLSDKSYVSLFESTEYSELMAEVGGMQMRLKKDIELQTEKMLKDIPVATRSEMDEVYKTIYDLKKQVRQLEKMLDLDGEVTPQDKHATEGKKPAAAHATPAAKSTKK